MAPLPEVPTRIQRLPTQFVFLRELEAFDGPILSFLKTADGRGGQYLEKWCTQADGVSRSLIVRTEQRAVAEYLAKRISMLDLIQIPSAGVGFLLDRRNDEEHAAFLVNLSNLPPPYLPKQGVFHDETLRPETASTEQSFLLDGDLDAYLLSTIERRYKGIAGFAYLTEAGCGRKLPSSIFGFTYRGGWSVVNAFSSIRGYVPREKRAKSAGVSAFSPGVFTMEVPTDVERLLATAIRGLPDSDKIYRVLHSWSKLDPQRIDHMPDLGLAKQHIETLCGRLGVDSKVLLPSEKETDPAAVLVAGKLISAYYRRLWMIIDPGAGAEFLGAVTDPASKPADIDYDEED